MVEGPTTKPIARLGCLLVDRGIVTGDGLSDLLAEQRKSGRRLGEIAVDRRMTTEPMIARLLAQLWGLEFVEEISADEGLKRFVPESLARRYGAVPISFAARRLKVVMSDPLDLEAIRDLSFHSGYAVSPVVAPRDGILSALERIYGAGRAAPLSAGLMEIAPGAPSGEAEVEVEGETPAAPVIRLINLLFSRAVSMRASDLHLEPLESETRVRYRVDGLLRDEMRLPRWVHPALVSRIKVLARLDISERRMPQDGAVRISLLPEGAASTESSRQVDLRISIVPTLHGEKAVVRFLDPMARLMSLEEIGLAPREIGMVEAFLARRSGLILSTGPTGSGKTTTLYAMLNRIRGEAVNITTVEDPIEYSIPGISQIAANAEIGLTFARLLRSILRQDPNVILVGEIRDAETAEIAFRAAMTGHLVLSTLHTHDAPSAVTRLIDIGVPRFLIASALSGILAQRLIRLVCPECRGEQGGCASCNYSGYFGRTAIFEILRMSPLFRERIAQGASEAELRKVALSEGMKGLSAEGISKAREGVTTQEEILRVIDAEEIGE